MAGVLLRPSAQGGADGEITRQDSVFEIEVRIRPEERVVVRLEEVLSGGPGKDPPREREKPLPLRFDHLV